MEIRRRLVQAEPAAYLPDLAGALSTLGNRLSEVGDKRAALASTEEAVDAYRRLVQAEPAAYLPNLAIALNLDPPVKLRREGCRMSVDAL